MEYEYRIRAMKDIDKRLYYTMQRKRKHIKLKEVAEYIQCSKSLISMYENSQANLSPDKERKYIEYIENY
jgi:predicted transcriptional regulator